MFLSSHSIYTSILYTMSWIFEGPSIYRLDGCATQWSSHAPAESKAKHCKWWRCSFYFVPLFFVDLAITSPSFSAGVVQDSWAERGRVLVILRCTQISASSERKLKVPHCCWSHQCCWSQKNLQQQLPKPPAMVDSLCRARREVYTTSTQLGAILGSNFARSAASTLEM